MTKPSRPVNYTLQGLSAWALLKAAHINPASRSRKKRRIKTFPQVNHWMKSVVFSSHKTDLKR